jgi:CheY-like chemotaxis protein
LTNLVANAVKYGEGKPIEIEVGERDGSALVAVSDHGCGIAAEDQARIFERFERLFSIRHYGGFGLGLWIARQIVDAHGGQIEVTSSPGEGSTFRLILPKDYVLDLQLRIGVIGRNSDSNRRLEELLRSIAPESDVVATKGDGLAACEMLLASGPDVVFVSTGSRVGDDVELCRRLLPERSKVVCVVESASASDRPRVLEAGADHFLEWPATVDALRHILVRLSPRSASAKGARTTGMLEKR